LEWLIARVDAEVSTRLNSDADLVPPARDGDSAPVSGTEAVERLDTIPGVGRRVAEVVVAEIGRDMSRFPSADHLASWAGLVPGHNESAGKRFSGRTRKGSPALRVALVEAARAAARTRTYLAAQFRRLAARRGGKRAAVAVAHSILVIAYHLLRDGGTYEDLGPTYFDERDKTRVTQRLLQRLHNLGVAVEVLPAAAT
jgi:transposase